MSWVKEEFYTLLDLLSGDLSYDNVRKAKDKLKYLVKNTSELKYSHGCLLADHCRGDCVHFVGLPKVVSSYTTDEYGRPNDWCEVCWRGEQIKRLCKQVLDYKESLIQQALNTKEGRKALSDSMVEPIRTTLEYN